MSLGVRAFAVFLAWAAAWATGAAFAQEPARVWPTFAELEAAGARIGEVRVVTRDIFDTDDPREDKALFRFANAAHITTRTGVIERALLFKSGDPVSVRIIDETERLLRTNRYLYEVKFRVVDVRDNVVDIEVETRDTWTLDLGFKAGRSGGSTSSGIQLRDYNFLGTGVSLSLGRSKNVDRTSTLFEVSNDRAFGSWVSWNLSHASNSDGRTDAVAIVRPFYALDARWAAGVKASRDDRIDSVYNDGNVVAQFRHRLERAEVFGGWSDGLVDGWVLRTSLGVSRSEDLYALEPGLAAPPQLAPDERLVAPFVRWEWVEDRFEKLLNRNLVGRPEFFALGLAATVQLGYASTSLGSTQNATLYSATISRGFEPEPGHTLIGAAKLSGRIEDGRPQRQTGSLQAQYYRQQGTHWLFYASAEGQELYRPNPNEALVIGGDDGLRGYPLRYQSGNRRALATIEERFYTDYYPWRLFRIGGAAFFDIGRVWGGDNVNAVNPGWLRDAGVGLRIVSTRAAFSNVLHIDLAFPLDPTPDIKKVQFIVRTRTSF